MAWTETDLKGINNKAEIVYANHCKATIPDGSESDVIALTHHSAITVTVIPSAGATATIYQTTSTPAEIAAGTESWVAVKTTGTSYSIGLENLLITGLKVAAAGGAVVAEIIVR